jgi:nicotinate-nucleotide--dimethylbenzimidazole phosphoribosyltransferase
MPSTDRFERPAVPEGFDDSRAAERRADPTGWRYPDEVRDALAQAIEGRRDIRRFRPDDVPDASLRRLLEAAHRAPSVGYSQPWRFIVVRAEETRVAMRTLAERERIRQADRFGERARHFLEQKVEGIREAPVGLVVCCDHAQPPEQVIGRATIPDTDIYSTACAIQNLWLAARAEGLGVGWVSFYRPEDLRALLGIPERVEPIAYLCVGYPDERPVRPGLESAGWAARRPLDEIVYPERWPAEDPPGANGAPNRPRASRRPGHEDQRGTTGAAPALPPAVAELVGAVPATDAAAAVRARDRADELVKPAGSLGALETLVERWSAATGAPPPAPLRAAVLVCAADHGVAGRGTSLFSQSVSGEVAAAAARGETAIGVLARARGDRLVVADVGLAGPRRPGVADHRIAEGTADMTTGPAMTSTEVQDAILAGAELARAALPGSDCLVCGEIGIGNTTAAAAVLAGLTGLAPDQVCGRGTGLDAAGVKRKCDAVAAALEANRPDPADPLDVLRRLGGLELAALMGAMLAAAQARKPIVLDGFAVGVVALAAVRSCPALREHLVAAHRSGEPAHGHVLAELGLEPLLDLRLRLGEASGAALALSLIEQAGRLHAGMGTFLDAGVTPVRQR